MGVLKLRAVGDVWPTAQLLNQQIPTRLQSVELSEDKAETEPGNAAGIHGRLPPDPEHRFISEQVVRIISYLCASGCVLV